MARPETADERASRHDGIALAAVEALGPALPLEDIYVTGADVRRGIRALIAECGTFRARISELEALLREVAEQLEHTHAVLGLLGGEKEGGE